MSFIYSEGNTGFGKSMIERLREFFNSSVHNALTGDACMYLNESFVVRVVYKFYLIFGDFSYGGNKQNKSRNRIFSVAI